MINPNTFSDNYKNVLSDFQSWDQKEHASEWMLNMNNMGKHLGIDETCIGNDVYTILHNKDAHGRKGALIAIVKGTQAESVCKILNKIPEYIRDRVEVITMDLSDSMRAIARISVKKAMVVRDCFHVLKRASEGIEEYRLRLKREAIKEVNREKAAFKKRLERLSKQRTARRKKRKAQGKKKAKGKKRGRKPMRLNAKFVPSKLENGETLVDSLTKCRTQLTKSRDKWNKNQVKRAEILFKLYPKLKEAYELVNSLRCIFRNRTLDNKEKAKVKLDDWYNKVTACTMREIKSVKNTIALHEEEILNYFIDRHTNASAESLNSKLKVFRTIVKGISDVPFFMYRAMTVLCHSLLPRRKSKAPLRNMSVGQRNRPKRSSWVTPQRAKAVLWLKR